MATIAQIKQKIAELNDKHAPLLEEIKTFPSVDDQTEAAKAKRAELLAGWDGIIREQGYELLRGPKSCQPDDMLEWIENTFALQCILSNNDVGGVVQDTPPFKDIVRYWDRALNLANTWKHECTDEYANESTPYEMIDRWMTDTFADVQDGYYNGFFSNPDLWSLLLPEGANPAAPKLNREQLNTALGNMGRANLESTVEMYDLIGGAADNSNDNSEIGQLVEDINHIAKEKRIERIAEEMYLTSLLDYPENDQAGKEKAEAIYSKEELGENRYTLAAEQRKIIAGHLNGLIRDEQKRAEFNYMREHNGEAFSSTDFIKEQNTVSEAIFAKIKEKVEQYKDQNSNVSRHGPFNWVRDITESEGTVPSRIRTVLGKEHNQDAIKEQLYSVLEGPKSIESQDMMLWYTENFRTLTLLAAAFAHDCPVLDPELDSRLKDSVTLAMNWQKQCCTKDFNVALDPAVTVKTDRIALNNEMFTEDGTFIWNSPKNLYFKKDQAQTLLDKVKENFNAVKDSRAMRPYKAAYKERTGEASSATLALNTVDGLLAGLKSFKNRLKETDPIWLATNSRNFNTMKDRIADAIRSLKDFRNTPTVDKANAVKTAMTNLSGAVTTYHDEKALSVRVDDHRGQRRKNITEKFKEYLAGKINLDFPKELGTEGPAASFKRQTMIVLDMYKGVKDRKIQWDDPKMLRSVVDAYTTLKNFPANIADDQRDAFAVVISKFNALSLERKVTPLFLQNPAFAEIKSGLTDLAKKGNKIEKAHPSVEEDSVSVESEPNTRSRGYSEISML